MALDLNLIPNDAKKVDRPLAKAGSQPARIAQVIDLGVQVRTAYKGKEKAPARQVLFNHELVTDEYEFEDKKVRQRIATKAFTVVGKNSEKYNNSNLADYLTAVDPSDTTKGKLAELAGMPLLVIVTHVEGIGKHQGRKFANITRVMQPPEGYPIPELSEPSVVFDFDNPTEEAWKAIPLFIQEKIKFAVNYKGSQVEALVNKLGVTK